MVPQPDNTAAGSIMLALSAAVRNALISLNIFIPLNFDAICRSCPDTTLESPVSTEDE
jgi:hypothetical protein